MSFFLTLCLNLLFIRWIVIFLHSGSILKADFCILVIKSSKTVSLKGTRTELKCRWKLITWIKQRQQLIDWDFTSPGASGPEKKDLYGKFFDKGTNTSLLSILLETISQVGVLSVCWTLFSECRWDRVLIANLRPRSFDTVIVY